MEYTRVSFGNVTLGVKVTVSKLDGRPGMDRVRNFLFDNYCVQKN